ncbi:DUF6265 family protein [Pseudoduganella ginsengisoli]|uniref:DUF6265 domain-containing protein n=1 Tax=Pseudoduganella ginsengisoli TaxID=1462440 RepID=A0A6L6PZA7_9BURK|nr:DUF6265 family protein [Pseudoduganella ginsengisoli]MTW02499.1 hypothetical protein [Pseudoduganella ginsengisoli]
MRAMIAVVSMVACGAAMAQDVTADKLGWMSGCWAAAGGEAGSGEQWMAPAGGTLMGMSRTVKNGKTVGWEALHIRDVDGKLAYVAKPHNQPEAAFKLASLEGQHVVFENPQHDFPQRIIYKRDGDQLHARIEGTMKGKAKGIDFPLQKTACPGT